jgi:hypothetical protein
LIFTVLRLMVDTDFGWFLTLPCMRELSVAEQGYRAVLAV